MSEKLVEIFTSYIASSAKHILKNLSCQEIYVEI